MDASANGATLSTVLMVAFLNPVGWFYLLGSLGLGLARARWFVIAPYATIPAGVLWLFAEGFDAIFAGVAGASVAGALLPYALGYGARALMSLARRQTSP